MSAIAVADPTGCRPAKTPAYRWMSAPTSPGVPSRRSMEGRGTVNLSTVLKLLRTLSLDLTLVSRQSANLSLSEQGRRGV